MLSFAEIKKSHAITDGCVHYALDLSAKGCELAGTRPFRGQASAFKVSRDKNCFHCFSCNAHGNVPDVVATVEHVGVEQAAAMPGDGFYRAASQPVTPRAPAGAGAKGMPAGRLAIPIHDRKGGLVADAGRNRDADQYPPQYVRGVAVYNLHRCRGEKIVLRVEDYFDGWRLRGRGVTHAIRLPGYRIGKGQTPALHDQGVKAIHVRLGHRPHLRGNRLPALIPLFYVNVILPERVEVCHEG